MAWDSNRPTHVPPTVREACFQRDGHQCTALMTTGYRCPETTDLEAAHWERWQPGEQTTVHMVRTLCRWHHNRETQREAKQARMQARAKRPSTVHPGETHPADRAEPSKATPIHPPPPF